LYRYVRAAEIGELKGPAGLIHGYHGSPPALEIADLFRDHGPACVKPMAGHAVSATRPLKVMSCESIAVRTAASRRTSFLRDCLHTQIALQQLPYGQISYGDLGERLPSAPI